MEIKNKVGLMTLDSKMYNYGGMLQEFALWRVIQQLGKDCEIIDYDLRTELCTFSAKRHIRNLSLEKIVVKIARDIEGKKNVNTKNLDMLIKRRKFLFDNFRKEMYFSEPVTHSGLPTLQKKYSAVVCGSDQIWNPDYNVPSFFLDFVEPPVKSIIYAASVGKEYLTKYQLHTYEKLMSHLDNISVRELSAQKMLQEYSHQKKVELVLDPTLLLDWDIWVNLANRVEKLTERYVFCYFLGNNPEKKNAAVRFAKENDCKLITIPYLHWKYDSLDDDMSDIELDVGPLEFLNLIYNAEYVLTDSFHATVFSIIFDKCFRVFGRQTGNYNMNTRIDTLLSYFDLEKCFVSPDELENNMEKENRNCRKFEEMREHSITFLRNALQ